MRRNEAWLVMAVGAMGKGRGREAERGDSTEGWGTKECVYVYHCATDLLALSVEVLFGCVDVWMYV